MTELKQVYKCSVCGNIVEVLHTGAGELVCCGAPMLLHKPNTTEAAEEKPSAAKAMEDKHVPVIEKTANGFKVVVGSVPHPMTDEHYIEWIEAIADGHYCRRLHKPGDKPEAEFFVKAEKIEARAYCNLHGLWQA